MPPAPTATKPSAFQQAVALANAGRIAESVPLFARAVKAHPKDAVLRYNLANALRLSGAGKAAAQEYEACLKLARDFLDARMNAALLYNELGCPEKAIEHAKVILAQQPLHPGAILTLCIAAKQSQTVDALRPYLNGIIAPLLAAPPPGAPDARERHHFAVACVCEVLDRTADAASHFLQARSLPQALSLGLRYKNQMCDWGEFGQLAQDLTTQSIARPGHVSPLVFLAISDDPAAHLRVAKASVARLSPVTPLPPQPRGQGRRLRIGYLSGDFRDHAVGYLTAETLAHHDRDNFDVVLYSNGPDDGSEWRQRFARLGRLTDLRRLSDQDAAAAIARDKVDVLVDMAGHTSMNRLSVLNYRPAKVVMNWLGYPGSLGASAVDYIIADRHLIRPEDERHYAEAVIRLPVTYMPASRDRAPGEAETVERPAGGFILSAFNHTSKLTPDMFGIWCRLLRHRDDAILWLPATGAAVQANLRREAAGRHVDPDRLVFAERVALASTHLARYRHVDLQLDGFPYGGHTTTNDALLMGCPVLTLSGEGFPSRVAGSLLSAVGLADFVCHSAAEYEHRAMELMDNPALLADARARIRSGNDILFQPERFCRELEFAYRTAITRRNEGLPPASFDVPMAGTTCTE